MLVAALGQVPAAPTSQPSQLYEIASPSASVAEPVSTNGVLIGIFILLFGKVAITGKLLLVGVFTPQLPPEPKAKKLLASSKLLA